MKRWLAVLVAVAAVALAVPPMASAAPAPAPADVPAHVTADDGAKVVGETWLDDRTVDLKIDSPALGTTGMVRLFVPVRWKSEPTRTWPQLWLLHGCCEPADYTSWDTFSNAKIFTADKDVIVVMPTDGYAGMYTRWLKGTPDWDTFHTTEVRQIVERGYRGGPERAAAGVSIGGYGAFAYAFKHPGMFRAVASFSGIPNTLNPGTAGVIKGILVRSGRLDFNDLWGGEFFNHAIWSANNPFDHLEDLRGTALYVSSGNGLQGPLDGPFAGDPLEVGALASSRTVTDRLKQLGIPVTVDFYGNGTHSWPYWQRELVRAWPMLATALGL